MLLSLLSATASAQGAEELSPPPPAGVLAGEEAGDEPGTEPARAPAPIEGGELTGEEASGGNEPRLEPIQPPAPATVEGAGRSPTPPPGYGTQDTRPERRRRAYAPAAAPTYAPRRQGRIRYEEGMEIPRGARIVEARRRSLLIPGIAIFAGVYGISVSLAIADRQAILAVPIVGPVLWQLRFGVADSAPGAIVASLAQVAGLVLFGVGMKRQRYVEYGTVARRRLELIPAFGPDHVGLTLSLR